MRAIPAIRNNLNKLLTLQSQIQNSNDLKVKRELVLKCAELVFPIWNFYYPNDNTVRNCIETVKKFLKGEASIEEVREVAADVANTAAAAYVDDAYYNAAYYAAYTTFIAAHRVAADVATYAIKATKSFFKNET